MSRESSIDYFKNPKFTNECTSGKIRVVISPTGDVYPCEKLGYPNLKIMDKWLLGNIRDYNFDLNLLVNNIEAKKKQSLICSSKCHCDHNIDQSLKLLTQSKYRKELIVNTLFN